MPGLFYNLGAMAGPTVRKGKWLWQSLTGTDDEIIEAEEAVGRDLAAEMAQQLGIDEDARTQRAVREIGGRLAGRVKNRRRRFDFHVVAGGTANAFALPGGFIFITRPLIELIGGAPDELAFILGHEMGHVIEQHPMQRIMSDAGLSAALRITPAGRLGGAWLKNTAAQMLQSAYSQDRELIADRFGARLAAAAGYDALACPRMLGRLKQVSVERQLPLAEYFSTHPPLDLRVSELQRYLK